MDKLYYPHIFLIPISPYLLHNPPHLLFLHYLNGYELHSFRFPSFLILCLLSPAFCLSAYQGRHIRLLGQTHRSAPTLYHCNLYPCTRQKLHPIPGPILIKADHPCYPCRNNHLGTKDTDQSININSTPFCRDAKS